jgi:hypothetical protein
MSFEKRLQDVELGRGLDRPLHVAGALPERVGQRQQDAADFLGFLLFERDDVVVDFDRAERLEKQTGAAGRRAVDDAGDAGAVLGLDHQDVAAVALGDDLILQVLRRVLAAQVRLERAAQPRPLLAQALADDLQLGAGVVDDLARRVDLLARVRGLVLERRRAAAGGLEQRIGARRAADGGARLVDRVEEVRQREQAQRFERPPFDRERVQDLRQLAGRAQREDAVRVDIAGGFAGGCQQLGDDARVGRRLQSLEALRPHRRQREVPDGVDDPIEFERAQGTWLHIRRNLELYRRVVAGC